MYFKEALERMKSGTPMKLPSWGGYWEWDSEKETIIMHTKEGAELDIRDTQNVGYTLSNVCSPAWIPATAENTTLFGGAPAFGFDDVIRYLKRGAKVKRKGWNGKKQYLVLIDPYHNDNFVLTESENISGTLYPYIAIKTDYNVISPWAASPADMLAKDWTFADKED